MNSAVLQDTGPSLDDPKVQSLSTAHLLSSMCVHCREMVSAVTERTSGLALEGIRPDNDVSTITERSDFGTSLFLSQRSTSSLATISTSSWYNTPQSDGNRAFYLADINFGESAFSRVPSEASIMVSVKKAGQEQQWIAPFRASGCSCSECKDIKPSGWCNDTAVRIIRETKSEYGCDQECEKCLPRKRREQKLGRRTGRTTPALGASLEQMGRGEISTLQVLDSTEPADSKETLKSSFGKTRPVPRGAETKASRPQKRGRNSNSSRASPPCKRAVVSYVVDSEAISGGILQEGAPGPKKRTSARYGSSRAFVRIEQAMKTEQELERLLRGLSSH